VLAAAILLYVGGGLTTLSALIAVVRGILLPPLLFLLLGVLYLGLARAVQRGRPWARPVVLVLSGLGIAVAVVGLVVGGLGAIGGLAWPIAYAVLLSTDSARAWFRPTP
jgi:ABC-type enterochelin transport system permease subunit